MTDWLLPLLLVPVIVAPLALAFGFSGCQLVFPLNSFPPSPATVTATATSPTTIRVEWLHSDAALHRFEVQRRQEGQTTPDFLLAETTVLDDTGLTPGTTYFYVVVAINASNERSALSNEATATTLVFTPAFTTTLTNNQTQQGGRCLVQRIEPSQLLQSGQLVRITLRASTQGDVVLERVSISHAAAAGDPYDSDSAPTPVVAAQVLSASTTLQLPEVAFALDRTRPLLVAFDLGPPGHVRHLPNVPAASARAFLRDGDEALVQDRSPGYDVVDRIYLIERIEVA